MKKQTYPAATAALLVAFSAAATPPLATAADRETLQMMADVRMLQIQSQELQLLVAKLSETVSAALKTVDARLDEQADTNRKGFADQKLATDAFGQDLRVLRERVDDGSVRVGTLAQEIDSLRQLVTALRMSPPDTGEDPLPGDADSSVTTPAPPADQAMSGAAALGMSPARFWIAVMDDYYRGDYEIAIMGFEQYVRAFPSGARAVDAQVNIGHSYMLDGNYEKAVEAYELAIRTYPAGEAIAEAHVKVGEAYFNLKQPERAAEAWQHVIEAYPDSNAALQARQRLPSVEP